MRSIACLLALGAFVWIVVAACVNRPHPPCEGGCLCVGPSECTPESGCYPSYAALPDGGSTFFCSNGVPYCPLPNGSLSDNMEVPTTDDLPPGTCLGDQVCFACVAHVSNYSCTCSKGAWVCQTYTPDGDFAHPPICEPARDDGAD